MSHGLGGGEEERRGAGVIVVVQETEGIGRGKDDELHVGCWDVRVSSIFYPRNIMRWGCSCS